MPLDTEGSGERYPLPELDVQFVTRFIGMCQNGDDEMFGVYSNLYEAMVDLSEALIPEIQQQLTVAGIAIDARRFLCQSARWSLLIGSTRELELESAARSPEAEAILTYAEEAITKHLQSFLSKQSPSIKKKLLAAETVV